MKNLITATACLAILLAFVIQFTQNQMLYSKITALDQAVNVLKETAKQDGGLSQEAIDDFRSYAVDIVGCSTEEVKVRGTKPSVGRGKRIHYIIDIPLQNVIGAAEFWGIGKKDNRMNYHIDRYTTSEYIGE